MACLSRGGEGAPPNRPRGKDKGGGNSQMKSSHKEMHLPSKKKKGKTVMAFLHQGNGEEKKKKKDESSGVPPS